MKKLTTDLEPEINSKEFEELLKEDRISELRAYRSGFLSFAISFMNIVDHEIYEFDAYCDIQDFNFKFKLDPVSFDKLKRYFGLIEEIQGLYMFKPSQNLDRVFTLAGKEFYLTVCKGTTEGIEVEFSFTNENDIRQTVSFQPNEEHKESEMAGELNKVLSGMEE